MKLKQLLWGIFCLMSIGLFAQEESKSIIDAQTLSAFKFRSLGPAFASGRIADIAIHPQDDNVWYAAVGSGGVWKTVNAGITWKPIFDGQSVYSIGCITIDPSNPHTIWVGTGENVGGRHVGFGDGLYKSTDDGKTWKNVGLKKSEHISKVVVHPDNSDVVWVAVQGPLWNSGDERGLYMTTNGGQDWEKVLGDEEWTGVTDMVMDPRNPDVLYAATWQRHRTVASFMGGGPKSGIHKSTDGGKSWTKLKKGLPRGNMGKIGLAISPQQPDILYAAVETNLRQGGVYRSTNQGASWEKRSSTVSGATGPHYYQELYACPHEFDRLYLMDVRVQVSDNGGKNFRRLNERDKHSDNHAIAFRMDDPDYLLIGTDAGIYESFDLAKNWRFVDNLPLTQYYKVAVDDAEPFYNIFGGTQDNGSHGGPSRTDNSHGISNADWFKTLGADGHQSATEPGNPNITYAETQQGGLHRIDRITGEQIFIQPQPRKGEDYERYNWDAPIVVSPHAPSRLYFASQRVWRSEDRGDSWTPISGDLTRDEERFELPIMGQTWSWEAAWDVYAMSNYNTITSLSESPQQAGLIYAGTDDGIIQVTEDGGANWRKIEAGSIDGIPATAFINDIKADLHDVNTVYVALDNHKYGDFKPYLLKSTDRGRSWTSITEGLPEKTLVWRTVQDHVKPELMFAATEFGIYVSLSGGNQWTQLKGGLPTISFRDLAIQKRENDLVGASFGRGFYVLDDYTALRSVSEEQMQAEATLFPTRKAWLYSPKSIIGNQGAAYYAADNPDFGAVFTYHLSKSYPTLKSERKKKEKELKKEEKAVTFPGWEALDAEKEERATNIWLIVKDPAGKVIRRVKAKGGKGFHRVAWDLRHSSKNTLRLGQSSGSGWWNRGNLVAPGTYSAYLAKEKEGMLTKLTEPVDVEVQQLRDGALPAKSKEEVMAYQERYNEVRMMSSACNMVLNESMDKIKTFEVALNRLASDDPTLNSEVAAIKKDLKAINKMMSGNSAKNEVREKQAPTISTRLSTARRGLSTSYGPTAMHKESLDIAAEEVKMIMQKLAPIAEQQIPAIEQKLMDAGAPWMEGQALPKY
ncbi:MAG: glycosyl hydrolase [Saprospiraceae bacterium]|nr:glycosyl hydrolase [Saprospiraceae bacterium]